MPSVEAHHRVSGPNTGRNSGGRGIKNGTLSIHDLFIFLSKNRFLASAYHALKFEVGVI